MAIIDTNAEGAVTGNLSGLTTQTIATVFVKHISGGNNNYRIGASISPDAGTTWIDVEESVRGTGCISFQCVATDIRIKVIEAEGSASSADVFILAR